MTHNHAIVWMDSKEAHIFRFSATDVERERVKAHNPFRQVHHKAGVIGTGHMSLDASFFDHIIDALRGATEWLLAGPASSKLELLKHIDQHVPWLRKSLKGVEAMDRPTEANCSTMRAGTSRRSTTCFPTRRPNAVLEST